MPHDVAAFIALSLVVICTPGPDTALIIRNTLSGGRRSGIATAAGIATGLAVWTFAASAGLAAVLKASEPLFTALKLAGAAYLVYLGVQSIVSAVSRRQRTPLHFGERAALTPDRALRQGLFSNLGNPKIAVFFASLLPQFVSGCSGSFLALAALGLLFTAMGLAWLTLYALVVSKTGQLLRGRLRRAIDALTGIVLVAFGARLAGER